jgi:hypothetical protein
MNEKQDDSAGPYPHVDKSGILCWYCEECKYRAKRYWKWLENHPIIHPPVHVKGSGKP